jgi:hypothetical protein
VPGPNLGPQGDDLGLRRREASLEIGDALARGVSLALEEPRATAQRGDLPSSVARWILAHCNIS